MDEQQRGELDWWKAHLPRFRDRIIGLYGMRYLEYFFREFEDLKVCADVGSGPMSAALVAEKFIHVTGIDPLAEAYRQVGLLMGGSKIDYRQSPRGPAVLNRADHVLCLNALDHTRDPLAMLRDCRALMKPSGKLLLWVHLNAGDKLHVALDRSFVQPAAVEAGLRWERFEVLPADLGPAVLRGVLRL